MRCRVALLFALAARRGASGTRPSRRAQPEPSAARRDRAGGGVPRAQGRRRHCARHGTPKFSRCTAHYSAPSCARARDAGPAPDPRAARDRARHCAPSVAASRQRSPREHGNASPAPRPIFATDAASAIYQDVPFIPSLDAGRRGFSHGRLQLAEPGAFRPAFTPVSSPPNTTPSSPFAARPGAEWMEKASCPANGRLLDAHIVNSR